MRTWSPEQGSPSHSLGVPLWVPCLVLSVFTAVSQATGSSRNSETNPVLADPRLKAWSRAKRPRHSRNKGMNDFSSTTTPRQTKFFWQHFQDEETGLKCTQWKALQLQVTENLVSNSLYQRGAWLPHTRRTLVGGSALMPSGAQAPRPCSAYPHGSERLLYLWASRPCFQRKKRGGGEVEGIAS